MIHPSVEQFTQAMQFKGLADCPQDSHWQIPADSDICTEIEMLQLLWGFVRALRPKVVVETGCNVGCASTVICAALAANDDSGMLYTCDTELVYTEIVKRRMMPNCTVAEVTGITLVRCYDTDTDLYWIDSSEDGRTEELRWIKLHGKPGAVVLVHDTSLMGHLAEIVRSFPRHVLLPGPRGLGVITL